MNTNDEHTWTKLIASLESNLAHLDAQITKESQHIRAELTTLRETRDVKRQELNQKIQTHIESLTTTIDDRRAALATSTDAAKASATAEIVTLEKQRHAVGQHLAASWHTQQSEWHHDLAALHTWAAKTTTAAKASVDTQIAGLESKRLTSQQEWDRRTHAASHAVQDLNMGADTARSDLQQARKKAADEFK